MNRKQPAWRGVFSFVMLAKKQHKISFKLYHNQGAGARLLHALQALINMYYILFHFNRQYSGRLQSVRSGRRGAGGMPAVFADRRHRHAVCCAPAAADRTGDVRGSFLPRAAARKVLTKRPVLSYTLSLQGCRRKAGRPLVSSLFTHRNMWW